MIDLLLKRIRTGSADRDAGSSLIEMLVTIVLGTLVMGMVASLCILVSRMTRVQQARASNTSQSGTALAETSKVLRAATPVCDSAFDASCITEAPPIKAGATATDVTFYAATDVRYWLDTSGVEQASLVGPLKVRLWLAGGVLTEQVFNPATFVPTTGGSPVCCVYAATPTRTRVLARNVLTVDGTTPIGPFRFFDRTTELALPLSATNAPMVRRVQIDLLVEEPQSPRVPGSRLTDMVSLPNFPVT